MFVKRNFGHELQQDFEKKRMSWQKTAVAHLRWYEGHALKLSVELRLFFRSPNSANVKFPAA
jgi:hypothetical protein